MYNCQDKIKEYILSQYPNEAVGVICGDEFIPLTNIHEEPETHFKVDDKEYLQLVLTKKIDYLIHSHTYTKTRGPLWGTHPCTPSRLDYINQKNSNVQWLIYATEGENVTPPVEFPQSKDTELLGRELIFYINDCFTLMRDYYHQKLGIEIPPHSEKWTWENGSKENCYEQFFKEWGFEAVKFEDRRENDVLIMSLWGDCNHCGVYINDEEVLHHAWNRQSEIVPLKRLRSFIQHVVRYKK